MWMTCPGLAGFSMAAMGSTFVRRPSTTSKPVGAFIQALTITTKTADSTPLAATTMPASQCSTAGMRSQP